MTVRLVRARAAAKLPELVLWRMTKGERALEARRRIVPFRKGASELRVLYTRSDGTFDLLWSEVGTNRLDVGELAQRAQYEYEVKGWTMEARATDAAGEPS
jgi:hypothetical protein